MVEHIAEQSAAIKLLQQGIVYQKVKWNYMKKYIYIYVQCPPIILAPKYKQMRLWK